MSFAISKELPDSENTIMENTLYSSTYNTSWALLIGINQYRNAPVLSYACNDAESLHTALVDKLGFWSCPRLVDTVFD